MAYWAIDETGRGKPPTAQPPSIAMLPFAPVGHDEQVTYLAGSLSDDMIGELYRQALFGSRQEDLPLDRSVHKPGLSRPQRDRFVRSDG